MKYAIVEYSGKQYLAHEGSLIEMDRMSLEIGKPVVFKDVLLVSDGKKVDVGAPFLKGASVKGKVQDHPKGKKIIVFKFRPKQRYRRKQGHRQLLTHVAIESIGFPTAPEAETKKKVAAKSKSSATKSSAKRKASTKISEAKPQAPTKS